MLEVISSIYIISKAQSQRLNVTKDHWKLNRSYTHTLDISDNHDGIWCLKSGQPDIWDMVLSLPQFFSYTPTERTTVDFVM